MTGSYKTYTVLIVSYSAGVPGYANLYQATDGNPFVLQSAGFLFGGARKANYPWTETDTILTKPLRPGEGGGASGQGIEDTMVFAIGLITGTNSFMDDDSGPGMHAMLKPDGACNGGVSPYLCHVISGGYNSTEAGKTSVWQISQGGTDTDTDGVPDAIEAVYQTSPTSVDTDNDNIPDYVELIGYVAPGGSAGVDSNSIIFPYLDAAPWTQDLYWEIDYMVDTTSMQPHSHFPNAYFVGDILSTFGETGWSGRNIRVHIDINQSLGHYDRIGLGPCMADIGGTKLNLHDRKGDPAFFDPKRVSFFHYTIVGHSLYEFETGLSPCVPKPNFGRAEQFGTV